MKIDIHSNEVKLQQAWIKEEIEKARDALERKGTDWEKTITLRARITALRDFMGLPERINNGSARPEHRD